eukprot:g1955.t1
MSTTTTTTTTKPLNVLMLGTGEYTTGYGTTGSSKSDKGAGVVALVLFDQRRQGRVGRLGLCGTTGTKFPAIRKHMHEKIAKVYPSSNFDLSCDTFPADDVVDPLSFRSALASFQPGDAVTIFTPDDTHYELALAAVESGKHVLLTKPAVKTLAQHLKLVEAAKRNNVLVMLEVHKRFDPIYADARDRIRALGDFSYFTSYMSQPKFQLETFRRWAGKSSDISYYLNSHHLDFHAWCCEDNARPVRVTAMAATGVAVSMGIQTEDTITLTVQWETISKEKNTIGY